MLEATFNALAREENQVGTLREQLAATEALQRSDRTNCQAEFQELNAELARRVHSSMFQEEEVVCRELQYQMATLTDELSELAKQDQGVIRETHNAQPQENENGGCGVLHTSDLMHTNAANTCASTSNVALIADLEHRPEMQITEERSRSQQLCIEVSHLEHEMGTLQKSASSARSSLHSRTEHFNESCDASTAAYLNQVQSELAEERMRNEQLSDEVLKLQQEGMPSRENVRSEKRRDELHVMPDIQGALASMELQVAHTLSAKECLVNSKGSAHADQQGNYIMQYTQLVMRLTELEQMLADAQAGEDDRVRLRVKNRELERRVAELEGMWEHCSKDNSSLRTKLAELQQGIRRASVEKDHAERQLHSYRTRLERLDDGTASSASSSVMRARVAVEC